MSNGRIKLGEEGLVVSEVVPRQETYYLVTDRMLNSLRDRGILTDVFLLLASLFGGAFFSTLITLNSSTSLPDESVSVLSSYKHVFGIVGIVFFIVAVFFFVRSQQQISALKKSGKVIGQSDVSESEKEPA
jgi:hypothetical protein